MAGLKIKDLQFIREWVPNILALLFKIYAFCRKSRQDNSACDVNPFAYTSCWSYGVEMTSLASFSPSSADRHAYTISCGPRAEDSRVGPVYLPKAPCRPAKPKPEPGRMIMGRAMMYCGNGVGGEQLDRTSHTVGKIESLSLYLSLYTIHEWKWILAL